LGRLRGVRFENADLGLDDLCDRPIAQPFAVRPRTSLAPENELEIAVDDLKQLGDQPALADPGHPDDRHELWPEVLANAVERGGQAVELAFTPHKLSAGALPDVYV